MTDKFKGLHFKKKGIKTSVNLFTRITQKVRFLTKKFRKSNSGNLCI